MRVEILTKEHDVSDFDSGTASLDNYLKNTARKHMSDGYGVTYVAIDDDGKVAGYYTISTRSISPSEAPPDVMRRMPERLEIPTVLLGKLSVRTDLQGQGGLGPALLFDVYTKFYEVAKTAGARFLELHAFSERAKRFYIRNGFRELADDPLHLFRTRQEIFALVEAGQVENEDLPA